MIKIKFMFILRVYVYFKSLLNEKRIQLLSIGISCSELSTFEKIFASKNSGVGSGGPFQAFKHCALDVIKQSIQNMVMIPKDVALLMEAMSRRTLEQGSLDDDTLKKKFIESEQTSEYKSS